MGDRRNLFQVAGLPMSSRMARKRVDGSRRRAAGGNRHHWGAGVAALAGGASGTRGGAADAVRQSFEADRASVAEPPRRPGFSSVWRLGLVLGWRSGSGRARNSLAVGFITCCRTWSSSRCTTWDETGRLKSLLNLKGMRGEGNANCSGWLELPRAGVRRSPIRMFRDTSKTAAT